MTSDLPPSRASSSRNDLFSLSGPSTFTPDPPPSSQGSPRTSSFFDVSNSLNSPSPAPRLSTKPTPSFSPSPLSLSRASSLRTKPPPITLGHHTPGSGAGVGADDERLSPLHQSPSLNPSSGTPSEWRPPLPPTSDDVSLRFAPTPTYLLGEGRYAQVFLASYKQISRPFRSRSGSQSRSDDQRGINSEGDGLSGGSWRLCAAKRMAPDRESQTMGLREAFFLNRLTGSSRMRSSSPLRHDFSTLRRRNGSVYIIRLIAVKEDVENRRTAHGRSTSDAITEGLPRAKNLTRQRSSTFGVPSSDDPPLISSPSLPALAHAARAASSVSRLVLVLEHAPLGTLDRLLRTSPGIVGRQMWERWARESVEAIAWVHGKGVVHADVKPGNLLLTADLHLRLSDFGSSLLIHSSHPPIDGVGLGTLPFSPPELLDPLRSFSFPVDIFALGATLYQCITGREPFRGIRSVEMMHHVRKGGLWTWEERCRLGRIGEDHPSVAGTPYPSAWREQPLDGLKRGGSLRVNTSHQPRPSLSRMSSAESLRASDDVVDGRSGFDSPAGVKLWAKWVKQVPNQSTDPMTSLLAESDEVETTLHVGMGGGGGGGGEGVVGGGPVGPIPSRQSSSEISPLSSKPPSDFINHPPAHFPPYDDGSPAMIFLDGQEALRGPVRDILKAMVSPDPDERPTADELRDIWDEHEIGTEPISL